MHILAESGSFVQTWTHPVWHELVNTALSLDHLFAEFFASTVQAVLFYPFIRWAVRVHDKRKHPKESNV